MTGTYHMKCTECGATELHEIEMDKEQEELECEGCDEITTWEVL